MLYLILSIACSTGNHLLFKAFKVWKIDLLCAIVTNYVICVVIGYKAANRTAFLQASWAPDWFRFAIVHGLILIGSYYLIALTTKHIGVAVASLSTRISVVIPTTVAFFLYGDKLGPLKGIGIATALFALYLSSAAGGGISLETLRSKSVLPLSLFLGFGAHLTLSKYVQVVYLDESVYHAYVMISFFSALMAGLVVLTWQMSIKKKVYQFRDVLAGTFLGFINYGSVYFLIRALSVEGWQSSELFPTISLSVVILSTLGAFLIFKESLHRNKLAALGLGLIAIVLIHL